MPLRALSTISPWEWPEGADKTILQVLCDSRAEVSERTLAAELAGDVVVMSDTIAEALLVILKNNQESEELRCQAAISIGAALEYSDIAALDLEDDKISAIEMEEQILSEKTLYTIQDALLRLYRDAKVPNRVRRQILEAAVHSPQEWHQDAVRAAYSSSDEMWRLTAVFCMNYISGFDKQILESLESNNPDLFFEAVCAAGSNGLVKAWPHIAAILTSRKVDKELLLAAIDAVPEIRPEKALDVIGNYLNHGDPDIVDAAFEALSMADAILEINDIMDIDDEDAFFDDD